MQVAEEAKQAIDRAGFECMRNVNEIFEWVVGPTVLAPALGLLGFMKGCQQIPGQPAVCRPGFAPGLRRHGETIRKPGATLR